MSYQAIEAVFEQSNSTGSQRVLLLAIAYFSRNTVAPFTAWPAQPRLAKYCRLSTRRIKELIQATIEAGELEIAEAGGGCHKTNVYRLMVRGKPASKRCEIQTGKRCELPHRSAAKNGARSPLLSVISIPAPEIDELSPFSA